LFNNSCKLHAILAIKRKKIPIFVGGKKVRRQGAVKNGNE
jgi:hypothetical protein